MTVDLPTGWETMTVEEAMSDIIDYRGKTPRKTNAGIPLVTARIVKNGRIETPSEFIDPSEYDDWMRRGLPEVGDVLVTTEAPLGEVAQLRDSRVALAQRLIALRGKPGRLSNTFLKFQMLSDFVQHQLRARSSGTTVVGIKQSELRKVELLVPPLEQQESIANVLGALDDKIELNLRMNGFLEKMARAIFKAWFIDFEPVRAKSDGANYFAGMPQNVFDQLPTNFVDSELGEIPETWELTTIGEMVDVIGGGTPSTKNEIYWTGGVHPFCTPKDMSQLESCVLLDTDRHITDAGVEKISSGQLPAGTVLMSSRAPIGYLAVAQTPVSVNQGIIAMCSENIPNTYILFWTDFNMQRIKNRAGGSTFAEISKRNFRPIPSLQPPNDVLRAFGDETKPLLDEITLNDRESIVLAQIRDTLLPRMISGEIQVGSSNGGSDG